MFRTASLAAQATRDIAEKSGAPADAGDEYARAQQMLNLSASQNQAGQKIPAIRSLYLANRLYSDASAQAKRVADDRRRTAAIPAPTPPPAPVPAAAQSPAGSPPDVEATSRAKLAESIREASRACVDALRSGNLPRVIALYPGLSAQQRENMARLRDLMNRSEAQFAVVGEAASSPEFTGTSATQDLQVRVSWKRFSGQRRNETIQVRSSVSANASGPNCQMIGTVGLR
jgi:hypothetical protein